MSSTQSTEPEETPHAPIDAANSELVAEPIAEVFAEASTPVAESRHAVESVEAAASAIGVLQGLIATLAAQRDSLTEQIGRLSVDFESKRARALEDHQVDLAKALRKAEAEHAVEVKALSATRERLANETAKLEAEHAAKRLDYEAEHAEWAAAARAAVQTELAALRKLETERIAEEVRTAEATIAETRKALDEELSKKRNAAATELAELRQLRLSDIVEREAAVQKQSKDAAAATADAAVAKRRAEAAIAVAKEDEEAARRLVPAAEAKATLELRRQLEAAQAELERELARSAQKDNELLELRTTARAIGNRTPEEVLAELQRVRDEAMAVRKQLADRPTKEEVDRLQEKADALEARSRHGEKDRAELSELRSRKEEWNRTATQLQDMALRIQVEETRRKSIEGQCEKLTIEVNRLRSLHERPQERDARVREIQRPACDRRGLARGEITEMGWLQEIEKRCKQSGVEFPRRLLHSFHTALKTAQWSPITVLSGVSGTGKSMLPKLYSRFGGINYLSVPVQPNWDSPQAVFGFFNSVDNRFNATPLLRLLTQSARAPQDHSGLSDQMTLILLDEMNLAHVELYFSEMLSKLEDRRGDRKLPSYSIDIGADTERLEVPLDHNVLWCGTMNEDETTKTLSDKVLDRGNMLVFPRPNELVRRRSPDLSDEVAPLPRKEWENWMQAKSPFSDEEVAAHKKLLEEMSHHMESVGRAIGHRVWQSIEYYMANHPLVRAARDAKDQDRLEEAMLIALEDQVVLKVMPKLRGIETRGVPRRNCLDPIAKLVDDHFCGLSDDFRAALENGSDSFMWRSANYLSQYPSDARAADAEVAGEPAPAAAKAPAPAPAPKASRP